MQIVSNSFKLAHSFADCKSGTRAALLSSQPSEACLASIVPYEIYSHTVVSLTLTLWCHMTAGKRSYNRGNAGPPLRSQEKNKQKQAPASQINRDLLREFSLCFCCLFLVWICTRLAWMLVFWTGGRQLSLYCHPFVFSAQEDHAVPWTLPLA